MLGSLESHWPEMCNGYNIMTSSSSPSVATEASQDKIWTGDTMGGGEGLVRGGCEHD